jgi:hypothetical protein
MTLFPASARPTLTHPEVRGEFPDHDHRTWLTCRWGDGPALPWLMCNPSRAGGHDNPDPRFEPAPDNLDPTLRRVRGFTAAAGYSAFVVATLFSVIDPDPAVLATENPAELGLDEAPLRRVASMGRVVCAWGADRRAVARAAIVVRDILRPAGVEMLALRTTSEGHPCHPLYLPGHLRPAPW